MRRLHKSKAGFSLLEMVLVVAIIVVLASVLTISVSTYLRVANEKSSTADERRRSAVDTLKAQESRIVTFGFGNTSASGISVNNLVRSTAGA